MTTNLGYCAPGPGTTQARALHRIFSALQNKYRRVLEVWSRAGGSIEEASHVMAISVSNAKVIQRCALRTSARLAQEAAR